MGARFVDEETIRRWISENSPSPGGGSLLSATVELTDAQIKALPTDPIQIVAAPGVNKIIVPISCIVVCDTTAGAYTDLTDSGFDLQVGGDSVSCPLGATTLLSSGEVRVGFFALPLSFVSGIATFGGQVFTADPRDVTILSNAALTILDNWNGGTPYGGGNAANTLKVTVYYVVVDL